jgi:hypothetical protein
MAVEKDNIVHVFRTICKVNNQFETMPSVLIGPPFKALAVEARSGSIAWYAEDKTVHVYSKGRERVLDKVKFDFDKVVMEFATPDYIVMLFQAKSGSMQLVVVDSSLGMIRLERTLDHDFKPSSQERTYDLRFFTHQSLSFLAITVDSHLAVYPLRCDQPTLLDGLRAMRCTNKFTESSSPSDALVRRIREATALEDFEIAFQEACSRPAPNPLWLTTLGADYSKPASETIFIPPEVLKAAAEKCLSNNGLFFSDVVFDRLLKTEQLSVGSGGVQLLKTLMELKQFWAIHLALRHIRNVSESDLVELLKFFISTASAEELALELANRQVELFPFSKKSADQNLDESARGFFLRSVLATSYSDAFLPLALKKVTKLEVFELLQFVLKWGRIFATVGSMDSEQWMRTRPADQVAVWTFQKFLEFTTCLIDSHVTSLILSTESYAVIEELGQIIHNEFRAAHDLLTAKLFLGERFDEMAASSHRLPFFARKARKDFGVYGVEIFTDL